MKTVYESTFIAVGLCAQESLDDNFIITFGEGAPADVAEYCFIHRVTVNDRGDFGAGSVLTIGEKDYPVTAVGVVARENLRELGHITVRFDGAGRAEFPGTVHVAGTAPVSIEPGQTFRMLSE
ncbi:PTS glucitol/sorbitol transporter subunit IIA [Pectobacterium odoriferum]|uniref:PTS glucitol/sorbitol transporter subunit IIA n=1 Tax=Pectobacterium odoriferum TaxID=78398 RepID=A0ABD6VTV1_9GAMM|nr:PTS glucitol/sorbitol transporter subunit IIA [Pectobacterium odoriferum]MCA6961367.1 PTS glucitol/sorbitol transporter subunit IIA [Pectobacterium odoriferum]MCH5009475.1 PTS glucitol/sorbitol transporter subunit IIA [Pectobacterium odoriferum]POD95079.1 PTS glucitol/sorbitol transporter subunit IIA [Pectobacterium odoriferum]POD98546.1 PTS glucitol/sorbitol transporter subunit IIA [Pectobacterium odoriferum]POE06181.1 PTS glucitol/sorbitol transporter subunit IIA [Pectobacterium odoriferu